SFKETASKGALIDIIDDFKNEYTLIGNDGPVLYFKTDLDAPKGRVVSIDLRLSSPPGVKQVIPQAEENLSSVSLVGDRFLATYLKDAKTLVRRFKLDGTPDGEVKLPGIGTAAGFGGKKTDTETYYSFSSFATPPSIYRYDVKSGKSTLFR